MPKRKGEDKLIVILGPTSCGKTSLAVKLAKVFNGEIISADSRQVYKGMDIGAGKDLDEYGNVPYHLIDVASPKSQFSLAEYQKLAYKAIDDIIKRGKTPFLVGGAGLYLSAVIDGYRLSDAKPDKKLREHLNTGTLEQLQKLVAKYKLQLNKSDFNNKRRIIRNIEIFKSNDQMFTCSNVPRYDCLILGIKYPKKIIDERIDKRLIHRLEKEGMIDEVKKLHKQGVSWKKLEGFGLEYKWIACYLQKKISYDVMAEKLAIAIHQFAKRQMTWFKKDKRIKWIKDYSEAKKTLKKFIKN
ncbi:tRNA (adenosine(37)-N6)-dimethylallyltransferase MiaA [Patescibacteria group bacterium]|nr:tRNA (adenosine(37)-N6)-dimethylallyltransferase MiaA [Patescibacteria group bacterium]